MTVRELIKNILNSDMDSEVHIRTSLDKDRESVSFDIDNIYEEHDESCSFVVISFDNYGNLELSKDQ